MDLGLLFTKAATTLGKAFFTKGVSISVDEIRRKLAKDPETRPLDIFLSRIDECLRDAAFAAKIQLNHPDEERYRIDGLRGFFDFPINPPEPVRYLPHFGPVIQLRRAIESRLLMNGIPQDQCSNFTSTFNRLVAKLPNDETFRTVFDSFSKYDLENKLLAHLDETAILDEFRMTPDDVPLYKLYIEPKGLIAYADTWASIPKEHVIGTVNTIDKLVEEYFERPLGVRFDSNPILFIGADFGIGKSSFMRMQASRMARLFIDHGVFNVPVFYKMSDCAGHPRRIRTYLDARGLSSPDSPALCLFLDGLDEGGTLADDFIINTLEYLEELKGSLTKGTKIIVSSRFILGPGGALAKYIRVHHKGQYVRMMPLDNAQIENWFSQLGRLHGYQWAAAYGVAKLRQIGLTEAEYTKPLYLWMLSELVRKRYFNPLSGDLPLGRTGLYLLFMNFVSREAKPKDTCARFVCDDRGTDEEKEVLARSLLQYLAALHNILPSDHGLTQQIVEYYLLEEQKLIYSSLGGYRFLVLSYFGYLNESFEFTHQTFKEFLIAEYLLTVFLREPRMSGDLLAKKAQLCIGSISTATAEFFKTLVDGLALSVTDESIRELLTPFIQSAVCISHEPYGMVCVTDHMGNLNNKFLHDTALLAQSMFRDDRSVFANTEDVICPRVFNHFTSVVLPRPHLDYPLYQERWLALIVGSRLSNNENFLGECHDVMLNLVNGSVTIPEWVMYLQKGAYLKGANLMRRLFQGANLQGANLEGANLAWADLSRANLTNARLNSANLFEANLESAELGEALLIKANLNGARLYLANLRGAVMSEANLRGAMLVSADLNGADLSNSYFNQANLECAKLKKANLSRANGEGAHLGWANLNSAEAESVNFGRANLIDVNLEKANLSGAILAGAFLFRANLRKACLEKANLINANLQWANLQGVNFSNANLINADLQWADFEGANLINANLARARLYGAQMGNSIMDDEQRKYAIDCGARGLLG